MSKNVLRLILASFWAFYIIGYVVIILAASAVMIHLNPDILDLFWARSIWTWITVLVLSGITTAIIRFLY